MMTYTMVPLGQEPAAFSADNDLYVHRHLTVTIALAGCFYPPIIRTYFFAKFVNVLWIFHGMLHLTDRWNLKMILTFMVIWNVLTGTWNYYRYPRVKYCHGR